MSLRLRLTLSYLAVVLFFGMTFLFCFRVIWPLFGPNREIPQFPPELKRLLASEPSITELKESLRQRPSAAGARIQVFTKKEALESDASILREAAKGKHLMRGNSPPGFEIAGPIEHEGQIEGVLSIVFLPPGKIMGGRVPPYSWRPPFTPVEKRNWGQRPGPEPGQPIPVSPIMFTPEFRHLMVTELFRAVGFSVLFAGLVCFGIGLFLSNKLTKPVEALVTATRDLTPQNLSARVSTHGPAELGALATSFNEMADGLEAALRQAQEERNRAQRSEESRREFLADVSHNLRTPLTAAQGWLDALIDGVVEGEEDEYLRRTQRQILYVSKTVQRLLDLSRWEGRIPELAFEPIDFHEALMVVVESLEEAAMAKEIELSIAEVEPGTWVLGDRLRTRELLQILLENAVEHAGDAAHLEVKAKKVNDRLEVVVADDGPGFPEDEMEHLTERYRSPGGGVGLGLAIADKLVRASDSKLELLNREGGGAMVKFSLPISEPSP